MQSIFQNDLKYPQASDIPIYSYDGAQMLLVPQTDKSQIDTYLAQLTQAGWAHFDTQRFGENEAVTLLRDGAMLHVDADLGAGEVRIVHDPAAALYRTAPTAAEHPRQTMLYQFETDHTLIDCGMCYILQCDDGSFFIIDSAHFYSFSDNDRIHKFLRARTPAGEKIVIAGWYFSHAHADHICKFMDFLRYNCDDVELETLYFNFLPIDHPDSVHWSAGDQRVKRNFAALLQEYPALPCVRIHTGQRFFVRNLEFRVLYTHEDAYPQSCADYNTSSSVLLLNVDGSQVLFPGDASGIAADVLLQRYGDLLKSDILQIAHHGHFGLNEAFYECVNARVALFPTTQIKYDEEYAVRAPNRLAAALADYTYISANGTVALSLPYGGGPAEFLGDETFEDFKKIQGLWGYAYTDEHKQELLDAFHARGGKLVRTF